MSNKTKKIKVINNMPVGSMTITTLDGKHLTLRQPSSFQTISNDDVWHIFNSCRTIQKGLLYIEDKAMRIELGLEEEDTVDVNSLSRDDLKVLIKESDVQELQELFETDLSNETKEKIVLLAKDLAREDSLGAKAVQVINKELNVDVMDIEDENSTEKTTTETKKKTFTKKVK